MIITSADISLQLKIRKVWTRRSQLLIIGRDCELALQWQNGSSFEFFKKIFVPAAWFPEMV